VSLKAVTYNTVRKYNCKFYIGASSISRFPEELFVVQKKTLKVRGFVNKLLRITHLE